MKKFLITAIIIAIVASLAATPVLAAGKTSRAGKSNIGHLYLFEKDPATWEIVEGGAWGKMKYNLSGSTFDFVFNGHELLPGSDYTLIYYPDKEGNPWPRTDILCLASGTADEYGNIHLAASVEPDSDLPMAAIDINTGAKIWLVLSSDVDCEAGIMSGWQPTEYLFEYDLITFDDTDV